MKKVALVTGAYKGLGFEWCKQLGKLGYTIVLTARDSDKALQSASELKLLGIDAFGVAMEVTDEAQIAVVAKWVESTFGRLDVLVNNAGINSGTRAKGDKDLALKNLTLESLSVDEVLNMVHVNAIAPILVAKHFRSLMAKTTNAIIIQIGSWLGSISGKTTGGNYSYAVSKSALNMMNRALAFDLLPDGIISVVVNPGWVQTDMGGTQAPLTAELSVSNIIKNVLQQVTLADTGKFFSYEGSEQPW